MELINQVPLLDQCVRLKLFGVEQSSLLYFVNVPDEDWRVHFSWGWEWRSALCTYPKYSAYTYSELQHMITDPKVYSSWHVDVKLELDKWKVYNTISNWTIAEYDNCVWAMAERVIYLIENKHINVAQINKLLSRKPYEIALT